jgi:hypothetical protein
MRAVGIAALAGLAAIPQVFLIVLALLWGRGLDARFGTQPVFTLGLLCVVVPISIFLVWKVAQFAARLALRVNQDDLELLTSEQSHFIEDEEELT